MPLQHLSAQSLGCAGSPLRRYFSALAPWFLYRSRWRARRFAPRALVKLDKTLGLEERAVHRLGIVDAQGNSGRGAAGFAIKPKKSSVPLEPRALFRRAAGVGRPTPRCRCWCSGSRFCGSISIAAMNRRAMAGRATLAQQAARIFPRACKKKQKTKDCAKRSSWAKSWKRPRKKISRQKAPTNSSKKIWPAPPRNSTPRPKSSAEKNSFSDGESEQSLKDLKAELEAARDMLQLPEPAQANRRQASAGWSGWRLCRSSSANSKMRSSAAARASVRKSSNRFSTDWISR